MGEHDRELGELAATMKGLGERLAEMDTRQERQMNNLINNNKANFTLLFQGIDGHSQRLASMGTEVEHVKAGLSEHVRDRSIHNGSGAGGRFETAKKWAIPAGAGMLVWEIIQKVTTLVQAGGGGG